MRRPAPSIACFVSPHGLGHAARAAAVVAALQQREPGLRFEVFTPVPEWFFAQSGCRRVVMHPVMTDVGMVQRNSLEEDVAETARRLEAFVPFPAAQVHALAEVVRRSCGLVVCDIAPLGIAVARAAGVPSLLVENFTWDWIYAAYPGAPPGLARAADHLRTVFRSADRHVQTEPVCQPDPAADLTSAPVSRPARRDPAATRRALGVSPGERMVVVTGVPATRSSLAGLASRSDIRFVFAGTERPPGVNGGRTLFLSPRSPFYHPDLVRAADALVGKIGYSTLAEAYHSGTPFGYVPRRRFPEAAVLGRFAADRISGVALDQGELESGAWMDRLDALLTLPRRPGSGPNGADQIAEWLLTHLPFR